MHLNMHFHMHFLQAFYVHFLNPHIIICGSDLATTINELNERVGMSMVKDWLEEMIRKYIARNLLSNKPLITSLAKDYVDVIVH